LGVHESSAAISLSWAGSKIATDADRDPSDARLTPSRLRTFEGARPLGITEAPDHWAEERHQDQGTGVIHERPAIAGSVAFRAHLPQP
jgi:hypothetical protein